jgi:hypothetical protein
MARRSKGRRINRMMALGVGSILVLILVIVWATKRQERFIAEQVVADFEKNPIRFAREQDGQNVEVSGFLVSQIYFNEREGVQIAGFGFGGSMHWTPERGKFLVVILSYRSKYAPRTQDFINHCKFGDHAVVRGKMHAKPPNEKYPNGFVMIDIAELVSWTQLD